MSPAALERAFEWARREGRLPRCVIVVNLYGQSADMDALLPLCERYGVPVLEDAAESLGAPYKGRASGSFGTHRHLLVQRQQDHHHLGRRHAGGRRPGRGAAGPQARNAGARAARAHYEHVEVGFNYRMSNVLAGIGRGQLRVLEQRVSQRRQVFEIYREALADLPQLQLDAGAAGLSFDALAELLHPARSGRRGDGATCVLRSLERHSIEARPVWKPMHLQPLFHGAPYFAHGRRRCVGGLVRGRHLPALGLQPDRGRSRFA